MISLEEKELIKRSLGGQFSKKIIDRLNSENITNNGIPYSASTIRAIVNGQRSNLDIENIIFIMVNDAKKNIRKKAKILKD